MLHISLSVLHVHCRVWENANMNTYFGRTKTLSTKQDERYCLAPSGHDAAGGGSQMGDTLTYQSHSILNPLHLPWAGQVPKWWIWNNHLKHFDLVRSFDKKRRNSYAPVSGQGQPKGQAIWLQMCHFPHEIPTPWPHLQLPLEVSQGLKRTHTKLILLN